MEYYTNKVIWITGASSGIGKALVKRLDKPGVKLVLSARNEEQLRKISGNLSKAESLVLPMDLSDASTFDEKVRFITDQFGSIDVLINNGGISQRATALETSEDVERRIMEVNYFGNILLSKAVLPVMREQGSGHLVIMSSIAGKFGFFLRSAYSASKHALHGYYDSLRLEEENNGISVTLVCPGKINTPISMSALKADGSTHAEIDKNQSEGMPVDLCAKKILKGVSKGKKEFLVGGKEINAAKLKRFAPGLLHRILRKQNAT